jgi:hypothetical protein
MQPLHFRPTKNCAVAIDDEIASAHGTADTIPLRPVLGRISLAWPVPARDVWIFA